MYKINISKKVEKFLDKKEDKFVNLFFKADSRGDIYKD